MIFNKNQTDYLYQTKPFHLPMVQKFTPPSSSNYAWPLLKLCLLIVTIQKFFSSDHIAIITKCKKKTDRPTNWRSNHREDTLIIIINCNERVHDENKVCLDTHHEMIFFSYKWQFYVKGTQVNFQIDTPDIRRNRNVIFKFCVMDLFWLGKTTAISKSPATLLGKCARYNEKW